MNNKKLLGILTEILYYLVFFLYLLVVKYNYSVNVTYDLKTFFVVFLVIAGILLLCGSHINKYVGLLLGSIYTLYLVAQRIYHRGFDSYFRFSTAIGLFDEVAKQGDAIKELSKFSDFIPFIVLLAITIIFLLVRYVFKIKTKYRWYIRLSSIICFILPYLLMTNMVKQINATYDNNDNFNVYETDFYIYDTLNNPSAFVDKFGLITYGLRDGQTLLEKESNIEYIDEIDEYFNSLTSTNSTNAYTGLFKDKSLIVIQSESLMNLGIDENLTPTLYAMLNSSIEISNFDTPILIGSTSDSEFMANTSFLPEAEGYSVVYQYVDNTYPLTLGNLFKDNGYKTNAFHNNYGQYYNRNIIFPIYGYEFADSYALGLENESADSELSEEIGWIDIERDKFMSYWISYSGHQPYEYGAPGLNDENIAKVKEVYPDLSDEYVYYLAKIMDFDQAVEKILNIMEWENRLDDVVIIIFGDHPAKGISFDASSNYAGVVGKNSDDNPEICYTPMFIWSNNYQKEVIDKYCTALDILPTICNLWDIDYDTKYAFGKDILDDSYTGFAFDANGDYWNSSFYYNSSSGQTTIYDATSSGEIDSLINEFNKKRDICSKILKMDYFAK